MAGSDELILSGGGSVAVATDALFAAVAGIRRFGAQIGAMASTVAAVPALPGAAGADSASDLADAARLLRTAAMQADALATALQRSAENYGDAERRGLALSRAAEALVAARAGAWLPLLLAWILPTASAAAAGLGLGALLRPVGAERSARQLGEALQPHAARILTDPAMVALLRSLVVASDDAGGGVLGAPAGLVAMLGEQGAGVLGAPAAAAMLAALGSRYGALREGPVRVKAARRSSAAAGPAGFRERVDRLPTGASQIRIERYSFPTAPDRFQVYLGGTRAAGMLGGREPWDMTSNVHGVADLSPGSLRAAEAAMRRSGVTEHSEVVFTGYSQGGLLATQLAASGDWNTQGLVTFGAPVARIEIPDSIATVQIEHTDDLVPAFGGDRADVTAVVVRREAFAGREPPADVAVPAHALGEYRATAELLDAARSATVVSAADRLRDFATGAQRIDVTDYRTERAAPR